MQTFRNAVDAAKDNLQAAGLLQASLYSRLGLNNGQHVYVIHTWSEI
jgi:hypothetical protein